MIQLGRSVAIGGAALSLLTTAPTVGAQPAVVVRVPEEYASITEAVAVAPPGATIIVSEGDYSGPVVVDRPLALVGDGTVIVNGIDHAPTIDIRRTQNVTVRGLTVRGGQYGISVIRSRQVMIQRNVIEDSRLAGIRVRLSGAEIIGNTITGAQPPYGRGIHVTNTMDWPMTVIRNNIISNNAAGGIVTNMARVAVWRNTVTDNGARGIGITEMSEATVAENTVELNGENGIYISDQSVAVVCDNTVTGSVLPTIEGAERYGNGITVDYNAEAELYRNNISGNAQHGISLLESAWVTGAENEVNENGAEVLWTDESAHWQEGEAAFRCGEPPIRRQ